MSQDSKLCSKASPSPQCSSTPEGQQGLKNFQVHAVQHRDLVHPPSQAKLNSLPQKLAQQLVPG